MTVLRVAHRAGNEPGLLRAALRQGADIIEADLWLRRGRLEVRHARSLGRLPYLRERFRLVPDLRLQLADLRTATPTDALLMLDLKAGHAPVDDRVRALMMGAGPYLVCSRTWGVLTPFARDEDVRVHSARTRAELQRLHTHLSFPPLLRVSLHRDLVSRADVARLRTRVEVVMTWPIDTSTTYAYVVAGAGAVSSNDLAALGPG